jgi:tRNA-specific 2-thiouridylase
LKAHVKAKVGEVVTSTGQILGKHDGLPFYTIGQREGIGVGGTGPYYVVNKNFKSNQLVVTNDKNDKDLWKKEFIVSDLSWVGETPMFPLEAGVSIRYHHPDYRASVQRVAGREQEDKLQVSFEESQRAITEGQAAVFYDADELLGGGVIEQVL